MQDKVILVSGGASGIGRSTIAAIRAGGGIAVGLDLDAEGMDADLALAVDVRSEAAVADAVASAADRFGRIDGLVNSAGIPGHGLVHKLDVDYWDNVLRIQLTGTMLLAKHVVPHMLRAGQGSIVNVASIYGMTGGAANVPYNVAKGGVLQLSRSMAADYGRRGIRVNSVSPGYIETPMSAILRTDEKMLNGFVGMHLLGRGGRPEEVASAILFLLSDAASFVTGVNLPVDGGFSAARIIPGYENAIDDEPA